MISGQRSAAILLPITLFFLICYLLMPYFRAYDKIEHSREASTIRINSLSIIDESSVKGTPPLPLSTPSLTDNDPTGQSLKLDQAHSLQVKMYGDRAFLDEQYLFDSSEQMFLVMEFNQLKAGEHNLLALWKSPNGQLVNSSRKTNNSNLLIL